ncbi:MAG: aminopeptidase P family protein [Lachnospiraceae bacterium]|nr:aminopeptidase P family protein [Lachnospiraceae bacterium]
MFADRRRRLQQELKNKGAEAVIIDSPSNLYYYTGFTGGEAMFVMLLKKQVAALYLITDSRYYEQVEKECPDILLVRMSEQGYSKTLKELLYKMGVGEEDKPADIAIEGSMELTRYLKLCETCGDMKFQVCSEQINKSRMVKDEAEISKIAKAEAIGDAAFSHVLGYIKPGVAEADIALELEFFMKRQGASALSFDTIVASGTNSSMPHAKVTDKKIGLREFVTMDFGCVYQGYCSDMTRTVAVGNPTEEMKKVYQIVLDANLRAMERVKEGVACNDIDSLARDYIREQGYGEYFGHGLGHGVGLDIHEEPRFSPKCTVTAKENMVITIEPGIYLPGRFGVRIEDLVVVKKGGFDKLSHSEKSLIVL